MCRVESQTLPISVSKSSRFRLSLCIIFPAKRSAWRGQSGLTSSQYGWEMLQKA